MKNRGRTTASYHDRIRPVERIELREEKSGLRLVLFCVFLTIAVAALGYTFISLLREDSGWRDVEVTSAAEMNCSSELVFQYDLGRSGASATAQYKELSAAYTEACVKCYRLFSNDEAFAGINNIRYINSHPGEEIELDALLYGAFEKLEEQGGSWIYLAPIYREYMNLFYSGGDHEAEEYDPLLNPQAAEYYKEICAYINDREHVRLELLGDNRVKLHLSEDYAAFARENFIESFVDIFWMKNAFIVDYIADTVAAMGYTHGSIASYDGFTRNLDSQLSYSFNLFDRQGSNIYQAAILEYSGPMSIVYLRDYTMNSMDIQHYYQRENGETRTCYIHPADGVCREALNNLVCCAPDMGCADVLMRVLDVYVAESFDESALPEDIGCIWFENSRLYRSDESLNIFALFEKDGVKYTLAE